MAIPSLTYPASSQNQRVIGYEIPGDEQSMIYSSNNLLSLSEMDDLITAAYRQIFNEQQMTLSSRQVCLESQLRSGQITVRDFIQGLATSDVFRTRNYDTNNNYRFVQMCVQRILGREVYNEREKLSWSIVLATKGLKGFIDDLLNTEEYVSNFGYDTVPYQRRRILPQRTQGDLPFARMARYDEYYRDKLPKVTFKYGYDQFTSFNWSAFMREANWYNVAGIIMLVVAIAVFTLLIGYGVNPMG
jgi:phycobilisome rod-core linker protein